MNNIALLFGLFPKEKQAEIAHNHKGIIQNAANSLQWAFVNGLAAHCDNITIINLPYLSGFPIGYKLLYNRGYNFGTNNIDGRNIKFCNLSIYNQYSKYFNAQNALRKWIKEDVNNRTIIIYAVSAPFISAAAKIKREYPDVKIVLIIPDLPEYMSDRNDIIYNVYKYITAYILKRSMSCIDYYVLLSKHMTEKIPIGNRPWVVVEGIYLPTDNYATKSTLDYSYKTILYTGTLAQRYGVLNLVQAFMKTSDSKYILQIYGAGDAEKEIVAYAKQDYRIHFGGQKPREDIIQLQQEATLLVNPRSNEGAYTKYSFPSKTIEYFASGRPALICKLPGIPSEYYKYCYSLDVMTIDSLYNAIENILSLDPQELTRIGLAAKTFVKAYKNPVVQCNKIINMINQ